MHPTVAARVTIIDLLGCVGAGLLERFPHLKSPVLDLLAHAVASFISPLPLDAETTENHHRLDERLKRAYYVVLGLHQVRRFPLGVFVR